MLENKSKIFSEEFMNAYFEVSKISSLSEYAQKYLKTNYSVYTFYPLKNELRSFLGGCFIVGYNIRQTELSHSNESLDIKNIATKDRALDIVKATMSNYEKIVSIAEYKEQNNEYIGLGKEVLPYSILDFDILLKYFDLLVYDFINQNRNKVSKYFSIRFSLKKAFKFITKFINKDDYCAENDEAFEIISRNTALGYCFKLAEEIIL